MKMHLIAAATTVTLLTVAPAHAQFAKAEDAIKYRQSAKSVLGTHFGLIGAMVNGRAPFEVAVVQESAEVVAFMSRLPWKGFSDGSDKGAPTRAKAEIWTEREKFDARQSKFSEEMVKFSAAAKTGDLEQVRTAFGATAQTCKGCHDNYRSK